MLGLVKLLFLLFSIYLSGLALCEEVTLQITGISSVKGNIRILVFSQASGFPEDRAQAAMELSIPASKAKNGILRVALKESPTGQGAIVVLHDLDNNGKAAKNLLGIPKEPIGASLWNGCGRLKYTKTALPLKGDISILLHQL